jgi:hypothetical protein
MNLPTRQEQFMKPKRVDPLLARLRRVHGHARAKPGVSKQDSFVPCCPWPRLVGYRIPRDWMIIASLPCRHITIAEIISAVSAAFDVSHVEILSHRRPANAVLARQVIVHLCRELTLLSLPAIGEELGGRDHTTIWHSARQIKARLKADAELAAKVNGVRARLEAAV